VPVFRLNLPLLATVVSWGFNFVALKLLYLQMSPAAVSLVRFVGMFALLVLICWLRKESLRYPVLHDSLRILFMGFIAMGVYMVFFLEGLARTTAADSAIILSTSPIFTALMAAAVGQERLKPLAVVGAFVALVGVAIVTGAGAQQAPDRLLGGLLILISSVVWAFGTIVSRPLVERYSPFRVLTLSMPGALVVLIPYGLAASLAVDWANLTPLSWFMLGHVAVLAGAVGFIGFYEGVRQIGAPGAMMYQYFVPLIATFFSWTVLGKAIQPMQMVGMLVVIGGVAIAMRARFSAMLESQ
jgi:drug/metabolite transporter (DMT)-like permease